MSDLISREKLALLAPEAYAGADGGGEVGGINNGR